mgnify:CR=1 FL=1
MYIALNFAFDAIMTVLSLRQVNKTTTYDQLFPFILCYAIACGFLFTADLSILVSDHMWTDSLTPSPRVLGFKIITMIGLILTYFRPNRPTSLTASSVILLMEELDNLEDGDKKHGMSRT